MVEGVVGWFGESTFLEQLQLSVDTKFVSDIMLAKVLEIKESTWQQLQGVVDAVKSIPVGLRFLLGLAAVIAGPVPAAQTALSLSRKAVSGAAQEEAASMTEAAPESTGTAASLPEAAAPTGGIESYLVELLGDDARPEGAGAVIEKIGRRRGVMDNMSGTDRVRLEFTVPSRGLFGYRSEFMTDTRGEGVMSAVFDHYEPYKGDIPHRSVGALVSTETGEAVMYGLFYAQDRGTLFCGPNTAVYTGMIVGQNARQGDIDVNVCRQKHLTSIRNAAGAETAMKLTSMRTLTLEECLEFIDDDELLEITPKSLRMRKRVLETELRKKLAAKKRAEANS